MKKTQNYKDINRNNNIVFNHLNRNMINPEILVDQLWLEENTSADKTEVEIVELNSSSNNSEELLDDKQKYNYSHAWSYIEKSRFRDVEPESYAVNKSARERRRLKNENEYQFISNSSIVNNDNEYETSFVTDHVYTGFYSSNNASNLNNNQMNCFTIIDKQFGNTSDTSSENDQYTNIEVLNYGDTVTEQYHWNDNDEEEITIYDPERDVDKRSIWIYSFKNKRLLSENDHELVNINSLDSFNTTCSTENDEEQSNDKNTGIRRVATPIPPIFLPKLCLSEVLTLPTLEEVTEPNTQSNVNEQPHKENVPVTQKSVNNWCIDNEIPSNTETKHVRHSRSTSIINWMALSPRERRRRSRNIESNIPLSTQLPPLEEVNSFAEESVQINERIINKTEKKSSSIKIPEDMEDRAVQTISKGESVPKIEIKNTVAINTDMQLIKQETAVGVNTEEFLIENNSDYIRSKCTKQKIKFSSTFTKYTPEITDALEKLDSNWIEEVKEEKEVSTYDYELERYDESVSKDCVVVDQECAGNKLLCRNKCFLKPAQWAEYLPITDDPPSIQLSLDVDSEEKLSWFKRLGNFFRCCK